MKHYYDISSRGGNMRLFGNIDLFTLGLYIALVLIGLLSIVSASFDSESSNIFAMSHNYMKQLMWIGISSVAAVVILLLERRYFHMFAYPAYVIGIVMLLACLAFGREVNGAKAWFEFGGVRVQPVEFVKIATALTMARVMSAYSFNIRRISDLAKICGVLLLPLAIIILQNDTGSGLVLGSFLFVMYREGLTKYLYFPAIFTVALFICSFIFTPESIFITLLLLFTGYTLLKTRAVKEHICFLAALFFVMLLLTVATPLSGYQAIMIVCSIAVVVIGIIAIKTRALMLL